jgi:hypothetical protein
MSWREIILWFGPAFAWVTLWTQLVTLRFFDNNETLFKDLVSSGAKDMALSSIETAKLIPALARLCDAVAAARAAKRPEERRLLVTEDILTEVDFLPHLAGAEAALRETRTIDDLFTRLQRCASAMWKISLLHSFAIILLPTSFLVHQVAPRLALVSLTGLIALSTFAWLLWGITRYQTMRDSLLNTLSINRKAD